MFHVVDFFCSVCQLVLSILSALFFFIFALIAHDFKTFSKILSELDMQRSKTLQLSACFRMVNVFGLPMWIIVRLSKGLFIAGDCGVAVANIIETGHKHFELALKSGCHLEKMRGPWEQA